jgi:hypothetical protein
MPDVYLGMDHFFQQLAYHCGLSQNQYWHLHLLSTVSFLPLLGVLYLVFFSKRKQPNAPAVARPVLSLWVNSAGQLVARPTQPAPVTPVNQEPHSS